MKTGSRSKSEDRSPRRKTARPRYVHDPLLSNATFPRDARSKRSLKKMGRPACWLAFEHRSLLFVPLSFVISLRSLHTTKTPSRARTKSINTSPSTNWIQDRTRTEPGQGRTKNGQPPEKAGRTRTKPDLSGLTTWKTGQRLWERCAGFADGKSAPQTAV